MESLEHGHRGHEHESPHHEFVHVELNGSVRSIKRGEYTGRSLKTALMIPVEHELDEVIKGEFRPVHNHDPIHIKGGEKFVSHCGQGQSS